MEGKQMATKREQLEQLVHNLQKAADDVDAKRAKGEEPAGEELAAIVKMSKDARSLKNEILEDAKAEKDAKDAGESLEDAKSFLSSLGIDPDAKAGDRNARQTQGVAGKTIGDLFMASPEFSAFIKRFPDGRISEKAAISMDPVGFKALITGVSDSSGGAFVANDRTGLYDAGPLGRTLSIRDVITLGTTSSDTVEYARAVSQTNAAAPVPEATSSAVVDGSTVTTVIGGVKPESTMTFEKVTANVKEIAHWMAITRRALADAGQLRTLIDAFLRYGLEEELEDQMVAGNGTGENFQGITGLSGVQTHAKGADSLLDAYRKARTKVRLVGHASPNAYLMHPNDWQEVDLLMNLEGNYYFGGPMQLGTPRLWGLPVVESEACAEGTAWVGDFKTLVLWDREQASIVVSESHADFFVRNLLAIRAEMRAAFGALRPSALVKITGI
jgi:HK97 family phage major capsid protein